MPRWHPRLAVPQSGLLAHSVHGQNQAPAGARLLGRQDDCLCEYRPMFVIRIRGRGRLEDSLCRWLQRQIGNASPIKRVREY